ncbi:hypothetical protein Tco_0456073 [Tanacetum coccineum]
MVGLVLPSATTPCLLFQEIGISEKNWNDQFLVDEFVVPAMLRFPEEFLCWVGISHNYLLNKDTYPRFEYEDGEEMDLNAFIRTADPRKVRVVERARAENERPIVTVAKHRTVTLLPTTVARSSGELSASVEREFAGDASIGDGGDQGFDSVAGGDNVEPTVPVTEPVEAEIPRPKRSKNKRVIYDSEGLPVAPHPPKRLRADYGNTGGSATGGKSLSALNRLLQDSRLTVEQGVPALPTLPFITSSVTASPLEEGGDHTDSVTGPSLRTIGPSVRFVVLSDSSHHSGAKSADPEVDSLARSDAPIMTEATTVTIPTDVDKDKSVPHPSIFGSSSSSERTDRTLSLFAGRSGSGFDAGSIRAEEAVGAGPEEIYILEWKVTQGFGMNDGRLCAIICLHSTLSLSSEVRMRAEYNIFEKRKWKSLAEEKDAKEESRVGKPDSVHKVSSELMRPAESSLRGETYEGSLAQLEEFQDNLMGPLRTRLDEIDADFTRCCMHFQESFHPHLLNVIAGRRWLLTHRMKLLVVKCLNSNKYMEALGHAFGREIEKGMQEGLAAGIEHGQAGRCLTDLEAYIPSAEDDFNSAIRDLRDLNFPLLQELSNKKDASTWDIMDLLRLDDTVAETLGMTDLQPDADQLMVPIHHKRDRVIIGSQALSVALNVCRGRVEKMERNLIERLPFLKDVFASIEDPLSAEALIEPSAEVPATNVLSTVVIVPPPDPSISVEDYDNPDPADVVPGNTSSGLGREGEIDASAGNASNSVPRLIN